MLSAFKKAGHRFQVVEDAAGLNQALKSGKYDLVELPAVRLRTPFDCLDRPAEPGATGGEPTPSV
jgi:hypothetical protein